MRMIVVVVNMMMIMTMTTTIIMMRMIMIIVATAATTSTTMIMVMLIIMMIIIMVMIIIIIIIIIIIALKHAIRDALQSPHCFANSLQHVRSSGQGEIVCKSRATHRAPITCNVPCARTAQLLGLTYLKSLSFQLYFTC